MSRSELFRWAACAVVVVAAHGLIALAIASRPDDFDLEAGAPVVTIELAPMSVAPPAPPADLAPGPQQMAAESQERVAEESKSEQRQPVEEKRETPEMPAPDPAVALPPPVPEPEKKEAKAEPEPKAAAPVPTAPPSVTVPAERPAAPAVGREPRPTSQAVASWKNRLMGHLERYKRYPARAHGEQGTVSVAFTIDHEGRIVSDLRITRSSGSAVLDDETLAMLRRAQPLPVPPGGIAEELLSITVPIRYAASR